jgi:hypothetical protein
MLGGEEQGEFGVACGLACRENSSTSSKSPAKRSFPDYEFRDSSLGSLRGGSLAAALGMSSTRGDDRNSEVCGSATSVGAHVFQITVEVGELAFGGYEAHLQSLDFAEPPVHPGLRNPIREVLNDLNQTRTLCGRHPQHRTPNTRMLVLTR